MTIRVASERWLTMLGALTGALGLVGCAETNDRGDVGTDVLETPDAVAPVDSPSDAAASPDAAPDVTTTDAYVDDAWLRETCDGRDDDGDSRVDEGPNDCADLAHGENAFCREGRCVCWDRSRTAHPGTYDDCNGDLEDGCETALDTEENCGHCGLRCDAVSRCVDARITGMSCQPVGILDLSVSRDIGEITCIVTVEHEVVCRGINTEHAISPTEPETSILDWTRVPLPASAAVRTRARRRADGVEVLSICALALDGVIVCRGDNGTGLFGAGDTVAREGNQIVPVPGVVSDFYTWGGEGYALLHTGVREHELLRWTAGSTPTPWLSRVWYLLIADMPLARRYGDGSYYSWGIHSGLLGEPVGAPPWLEPTVIVDSGTAACLDNVCCTTRFFSDDSLQCWSGTPSGVRRRGARSLPRALYTGEAGNLMLAPIGFEGRTQACVVTETDVVDRTVPPRVFCADVEDMFDGTTEPFPPLTEHPEMLGADGELPTSRVDWRAICTIESPSWWRCVGVHRGWGGPPRP